MSAETRFWSKVDRAAGPDGCWLWTASTSGGGGKYGQFWIGGRHRRAHRLSWEWANGRAIPTGAVVRHTCDTPLCVNPAHLELGTPADNTADMMTRGRQHQARKTHCPQGHPYEPGKRSCRPCRLASCARTNARRAEQKREYMRAYRARRKAVA